MRPGSRLLDPRPAAGKPDLSAGTSAGARPHEAPERVAGQRATSAWTCAARLPAGSAWDQVSYVSQVSLSPSSPTSCPGTAAATTGRQVVSAHLNDQDKAGHPQKAAADAPSPQRQQQAAEPLQAWANILDHPFPAPGEHSRVHGPRERACPRAVPVMDFLLWPQEEEGQALLASPALAFVTRPVCDWVQHLRIFLYTNS